MTSKILTGGTDPIKDIRITGYYIEVDGIPVAGGYVKDDHRAKAKAEFLCLVHNVPGYTNAEGRFIKKKYFRWAKYYPTHCHPYGKIIQWMALNNQKE